MAWEAIAVWAMVVISVTWFFRDEHRQQARRLEARAIHYATEPAYRYQPAADYRAQSHEEVAALQRRLRAALFTN